LFCRIGCNSSAARTGVLSILFEDVGGQLFLGFLWRHSVSGRGLFLGSDRFDSLIERGTVEIQATHRTQVHLLAHTRATVWALGTRLAPLDCDLGFDIENGWGCLR
jgi:hypothetical protein